MSERKELEDKARRELLTALSGPIGFTEHGDAVELSDFAAEWIVSSLEEYVRALLSARDAP